MKELKQKVTQLLDVRDFKGAVKEIKKRHATEVAEILLEIEPKDRNLVFTLLPAKLAAKSFSYLHLNDQKHFLDTLKNTQIKVLLSNLNPDDRTCLFEDLPEEQVAKLLDLLSISDLEETKFLLNYPKESVGRVMTPDYISVDYEWSVQEALDHIRENSDSAETADVIYITDESEHLLYNIKLYKFVFAQPTSQIKDILNDTNDVLGKLSPFDDQEKAVYLIKQYNLTALPVVDSDNEMLGIVTIDDLMDVQEEEITEDFHKIGGISHGSEDTMTDDLVNAPICFIYKKRIVWLLVLVGVNFFSSAAMMKFEDIIASTVVLVAFLPLLIDSAGNAGAQASTIVIRSLSTGQLKNTAWLKTISKEIIISWMLGISMSLAVSVVGFYLGGAKIALIVALTMISVVMIGSLLGAALPFIFSKLKTDPATASGPLVTSIVDILGVIIYFSIATFVLGL